MRVIAIAQSSAARRVTVNRPPFAPLAPFTVTNSIP